MGIKNAVLVVIVAMVALPLAGRAQPRPPVMFDIEQLSVLLDLDAYQKGELDRILDSKRPRGNDAGGNPAERRAQLDANRAEILAELQQVLTAAQLEKFEILSEGPRRGPGPMFRFAE